jgi:hypothetical protein
MQQGFITCMLRIASEGCAFEDKIAFLRSCNQQGVMFDQTKATWRWSEHALVNPTLCMRGTARARTTSLSSKVAQLGLSSPLFDMTARLQSRREPVFASHCKIDGFLVNEGLSQRDFYGDNRQRAGQLRKPRKRSVSRCPRLGRFASARRCLVSRGHLRRKRSS